MSLKLFLSWIGGGWDSWSWAVLFENGVLVSFNGDGFGIISFPHEISWVNNRISIVFFPLYKTFAILNSWSLTLQFPFMLLLYIVFLRILLQPIFQYFLPVIIACWFLIINSGLILFLHNVLEQLINML